MMYLKHLLVIVLFATQFFVCSGQPSAFSYEPVKQAYFKSGAVSCAHPLASMVGKEVMMKGGNAFDVAIAVQWALAVVYPTAGNIGGGGFMVARLSNGKSMTLDFREKAPGKATETMYVDSVTGKANTKLSQNGHLAPGVPGTPAGLFYTLRFGKLPMALLIQPAIDLAEHGFVITEREANRLNAHQQQFELINTTLPVFFKPTGWKKGDTLIQKDLAATLRRIRDYGVKEFYEGQTARLIVNEMERGGGIISLEDLKRYRVVERKPIQFSYKGYQIISMPPPSSGGILMQQMLKTLETRSLASYPFLSAKSVQLVTEVERRSYADRAEFLGDPDFWKIPYAKMVDPNYLKQRMADYDSTRASISTQISHGPIAESMETTHISIADSWGNLVSVTTTLNGNYGSKLVVGGAGFFMNNEMDDFSIQPGVPNMFGAIGGRANAIAPEKRMLSSMTPTIILKSKKPFMVIGSPGGTTIITSVLQGILNVIDYQQTGFQAVNNPKFHHQWLPDEIRVEKDFPQETRKTLEKMGYKIVETNYWSATDLLLRGTRGHWEAVGDKRGDDSVAGY